MVADHTKMRSIIRTVVLLGVCIAAADILMVTGCGETNNDRRRISQHTKDLAARVRAAPDSPQGKAAMTELIKILNGNWSFAQSQACYVLDDLGPLAAPAVPDLIRAAKGGDAYVQQDAIFGLRSIGPAAAPAVDLLVEIVDSATSSGMAGGLRELYAVEALGNIGEPAIKAIPSLERALQLKDGPFVKEARKSLDKLKRVAEAQVQENSVENSGVRDFRF